MTAFLTAAVCFLIICEEMFNKAAK